MPNPIHTADGRPYVEGRPELVAYVLSAAILIGLGIGLRSVVLNWIIGPTTAVLLVVVLTPICRRVAAWWAGRS